MKKIKLLFPLLVGLSISCKYLPEPIANLIFTATPTPTSTPTSTFTPTPTNTSTPTSTHTPTPTCTHTSTPVPLPGVETIPIEAFNEGIPWLDFDPNDKPGTMFFGFNVAQPPFDNVHVRQAFAAAVDRDIIVAIAERTFWRDPQPATTLIHADMLGRDLYGSVGIPFDPARARALLAQAGYEDPADLPPVSLAISLSDGAEPTAYMQYADAVVSMWEQHLGVLVTIDYVGSFSDYIPYVRSNEPQIYRLGLYPGSDEDMDPDGLIRALFTSDAYFGFSNFQNQAFDELVDLAASIRDPLERQILYIQIERVLCEEHAVIIPLYHYTAYP